MEGWESRVDAWAYTAELQRLVLRRNSDLPSLARIHRMAPYLKSAEKAGPRPDGIWFLFESSVPKKAPESTEEIKGKESVCLPFFSCKEPVTGWAPFQWCPMVPCP